MIKVGNVKFDNLVIDYCNFGEYVNVRLVVPSTIALTEEQIESMKNAISIEAIYVDRNNVKKVVAHYDIEYFVGMEILNNGVKFVWRVKQ